MNKKFLVCKWTLGIIIELYSSPKRPSELKSKIKGISERILFDRLNKLYSAGIVNKRSNNRYPLITYYNLNNPEKFRLIYEIVSSSELDKNEIVSLLTCKWTLNIMDLLQQKRKPKEIKQILKGISDKVLYQRLNELIEKGLIERKIIDSKPIVVKYNLTQKGKELFSILEELNNILFLQQNHLVQQENT